MMPRLLDTNFIVRHLVADHQAHAEIALRFFQAVDRGEENAVVLPPVLSECVFVLQSFYKLPRPLIASKLSALLTAPNIVCEPLTITLEALRLYANSKTHFVDCYIAATASIHNQEVATFDADFFGFAGVRVNIE